MNPLKFHRLEKGLTLIDLGIKSGVSAGRISLLERGKIKVTARTRRKIAGALGLDESVIFPEASRGETSQP